MNIEKSLLLFVFAIFLIFIVMMIFRELFNSDKEESVQCGSREDKEYTLKCGALLIFLIVLIFFTGLLLLLVREGYLVEWLMN